jgi:hypothetical protein
MEKPLQIKPSILESRTMKKLVGDFYRMYKRGTATPDQVRQWGETFTRLEPQWQQEVELAMNAIKKNEEEKASMRKANRGTNKPNGHAR